MQKKIAIIQISEAGNPIAEQLKEVFDASSVSRYSIATNWKKFDAFIFIGAMGICVRTIAPYIKDKHKDPAVVSILSHCLSVMIVREVPACS